MTIWQGTFYSQLFTLKDCVTDLPINITGWQFHAQFRLDPDEPLLLDLSTIDGELVIHNGPGGIFSMQIQPADTAILPEDETLRFDMLRTAPMPGPIMLFWGRVPVKRPVTHNG